MPSTSFPRQKLVLVADDDPLLVMLLEHHLTSAGYRVISAPDGETALSLILRESPDALILDQMMPIMGGTEVLRHLKTEAKLVELKVLMLTTLRSEDHVVGAFKLGVADFLTKPFSPVELVARVEKLVPLAA
jgi:DNA-binding response OmpR family regulator